MSAPLLFMDTETTGLDVDGHGSEPWEFAAIRRVEGVDQEWHAFLKHDVEQAKKLPESFYADYTARYDDANALTPAEFQEWSLPLFAGKPHIVGAVPDFDTGVMRQLFSCTRSASPWHYHLIDVETLAVGYLMASNIGAITPPWDSETLSQAVGVDPAQFARHTAMGDCYWTRAIWDAVTKAPLLFSEYLEEVL